MEDNAGLSASVATLARPAAKEQDGAALYITGCHFQRGRIALYAILKALGIGSGDEVIIQAFTCVAVPCPVLATGARPVYADIDGTLNLDPSSVEARLTPRTKAIVVQHTFGIPANMDRLLRTANECGIYLIEDCCHTVASSYRVRWSATLAMGRSRHTVGESR
jgi:dTDP-4-amino-4,6-dideoxygalactose transaminase